MERRLGLVAETCREGHAGTPLRTARVLTTGAAGAAVLRNRRATAVACGAALLARNRHALRRLRRRDRLAGTRFGVFAAGDRLGAGPQAHGGPNATTSTHDLDERARTLPQDDPAA
ncbi:hypothetical protein [Streptomyces sp. NPDC005476]|uniref:hypothetical protein n=1 Tax=Streptomyces sp. NPDC005476 TaxID=3156882 RepID=UPI0034571866